MYRLPENLKDLDHFRDDKMIQFKEENVGGVDVITPVYMISDNELWQKPYALELRGHVYRKDTGEMISAALPKFFNVGENAWTMRKDLPWDHIARIADKVDGSMITGVLIDGNVYVKTKKSFYSDVAIDAQKFIDSDAGCYTRELFKEMLADNKSPVFEFMHPDWRIVLDYGNQPSMKYLGYRDMVTSEWMPSIVQSEVPEGFVDNMEHYQQTLEGLEGWVIKFKSGLVVKAKTVWYLMQHRVRTEMRYRDVAELAALEKLDDVKAMVTESGLDLKLIEDVEEEVAHRIMAVRTEVEEAVERVFALPDVKSVALFYKEHRYFRMIMQAYRGQEVDYVDYFLKNILKEFGLRNVYNQNF